MKKLTAKFYKNADADTRNRRVWPKYATQLLNVAGQNALCFKADKIGSMKEMWLDFVATGATDTLENWESYWMSKKGDSVLQWSADKLYDKAHNDMGIQWITPELCRDYIEEVIFNKTHFGMGGEANAIKVAAAYYETDDWRFSTAEEESQGIDGWIKGKPVQVKPADSFKKGHVHNGADTEKTLVITYEKKKQACYLHNPEFIQ